MLDVDCQHDPVRLTELLRGAWESDQKEIITVPFTHLLTFSLQSASGRSAGAVVRVAVGVVSWCVGPRSPFPWCHCPGTGSQEPPVHTRGWGFRPGPRRICALVPLFALHTSQLCSAAAGGGARQRTIRQHAVLDRSGGPRQAALVTTVAYETKQSECPGSEPPHLHGVWGFQSRKFTRHAVLKIFLDVKEAVHSTMMNPPLKKSFGV